MRRAIAIVGTVAGLAVLGEAGHVAFERLGWETAHHAFHVLYLGGAFVVFATAVIRDRTHRRRCGSPLP
jgi:hypothetical protein